MPLGITLGYREIKQGKKNPKNKTKVVNKLRPKVSKWNRCIPSLTANKTVIIINILKKRTDENIGRIIKYL